MQDQPAQTAASTILSSTLPVQKTPSYVDAYTPPATNPVGPINPPDPIKLVSSVVSPVVQPLDEALPETNLPKHEETSKDDAQAALDELSKMLGSDEAAPSAPIQEELEVSKPLIGEQRAEPMLDLHSSDDLSAEVVSTSPNPLPMVRPGLPNIDPPVLAQKPLAWQAPIIPPTRPASFTPPPAPMPVGQNLSRSSIPPAFKPTVLPVVPGLESEKLEDQNVFYLLGIDSSSPEQKEQFLDELQQVIWEDFVENDVELLLTEKEFQELKTTYQLDSKKPLAEQEAVISYLEKLIPDLENLMLEKAIKLKADLVKERVAGFREKLVDQSAKLAELDQADKLIAQEKWLSAAKILNQLGL